MKILKEFREFIERGNVIDLAVAVVIGAQFNLVITSFTNDILMQIIGALGGKPSFNDYTVTINGSVIRYGSFVTAVVNFLIVAFAVFMFVKAINTAQRLAKRNAAEEVAAAEQTEVELLTEIRDALVAQGR